MSRPAGWTAASEPLALNQFLAALGVTWIIDGLEVTSATVIPLDGRLQVVMVRPDPRRERELEFGGARDPLGRQVRGAEGLRDDDLGVRQLAQRQSRTRPCLR